MKGPYLAFLPILLSCAGGSTPGAQEIPRASRDCAVPDRCSFENTRAGNEAAARGNYRQAADIFFECPDENLPNIVGLMERYPATAVRLTRLADSLEDKLEPPQVTESLRLLVAILRVLPEKERALSLYRRYLSAGFEQERDGWVFRDLLVVHGLFEAALEDESGYMKAINRAADDYRQAGETSVLSSGGIVLTGSVESYLAALVGARRFERAGCLINTYQRAFPSLFEETSSEMLKGACPSDPGLDACEARLFEKAGTVKDCADLQELFATREKSSSEATEPQ